MTPRQNATEEILYFVDRILPGSDNKAIQKRYLEAMNDEQFDTFIDRLENEEEFIPLFVANLTEHSISLERNMEVAEELGHDFFQRLYLTDAGTGQLVLTPVKHMVVDLPCRRQAQMLVKKVNIPENNHVIDERSGQVTGASKGSRISYPELQINAAKGLDNSLLEMINVRGGNEKARQRMLRGILESGHCTLAECMSGQEDVTSVQTLRSYLNAMHLASNL